MERWKQIYFGLLMAWLFLFAGCAELMQPVNNEPNAPPLIEPVVETGIGLGQLLGTLWPPLLPIATAAGGIFAGYKRLKPKLQQAQTDADKYFAAGETLASVLDDIKKNQPETWQVIGPKIADATKSISDIEQAIRGFRHVDEPSA